jgi:hypothetical protein
VAAPLHTPWNASGWLCRPGAFCYPARAMQPPDSRQGRWVSFSEARLLLGSPGRPLSEGTLRRLITAGKVLGEPEPRETGTSRIVWRVFVPDPPASATPTESEQAPPSAIQASGPSLDQLLDMHAEVIEAYQQLTAKEREIADLRERAASAEASASHETARANAAEARAAQLAADLERAQRPWWRKLWDT